MPSFGEGGIILGHPRKQDMSAGSLEDRVNSLPPELKKEVNDFVEFLLSKTSSDKKKKPRLDWIGGLREYRDKYTSLELQKKALEWRG